MKKRTGPCVHELIIAAVPFLFYVSIYRSLPPEIPVHYSFHGVADGFASKLSVEALFICSLGYCGLGLGVFLRKMVDAMGKSQENDNTQTTARLMGYNQTFLTIFFSALSLYFLSGMLQNSDLDTLLILRSAYLVLAVLCVIIGNYLPKIKKNRVSGVKTKYSQSSDDGWMKSQRFGGKVFVAGGAVNVGICLLPGIPTECAVIAGTGVFVLMIFGIVVFSAIGSASRSTHH